MDVTLLGTAGWFPTDRRETTCFAVRSDEALFLFDAGTGLRRLRDERHAPLLDGAREIHLFLTHYHLDHVCGLAYLPGVLPGRRVTVHAPAADLTGVDPEAALSGLLRRPYNPHDWSDLTNLRVEALGRDGVVAGRRLRLRPQRHSDTSVAYRVDDELVLATDTMADPETASFAADVDLLLHEAWYDRAETAAADDALPPGYAAHSEVGDVAALAASAGVGRLVLIHLNPLRDETSYESLEATARRVFPASDVRPDGDVVTGDGSPPRA
jgi:ribonuclease BN (tRNA processing enzyme)